MVSNRKVQASQQRNEKAKRERSSIWKRSLQKSLANEGLNARSLDVQQSRRQFRESIHRAVCVPMAG